MSKKCKMDNSAFWDSSNRLLFENKTDEELNDIAIQALKEIAALTNTPSDLAKFEKLKSDHRIALEIVRERKERKEAEKRAIANFKDRLEQKKLENVMNLKAASSFKGQLIASILKEEDGLTGEEIASWYEELSEMDENEFEDLLNSLCEEGIIEKDESGKYHLLFIMYDSLKAVPESEYCRKKFNIDKLKEKERFLLDIIHLEESGAAISELDARMIALYSIILEGRHYSDDVLGMDERQKDRTLYNLMREKLVKKDFRSGVYYTPMLGEKEGMI